MELSVMGFVSVVFNYILRCINGGLLNVAFTPKYNTTSNEMTYEFDMNQERLMQYLKAVLMVSGKDLPLEVLRTFPESIGGGDAGVKTAQENPNREVVFIIGPMVAAILMLIAILGLILISFCTFSKECCHCRRGKKRKRGGNDESQAESTEVQSNEEGQNGSSNARQFDNGYDGYAFYKRRGDGDSDSDDSDDDEPKGFMENLKDLFSFNGKTAVGDVAEERQGKIMAKIEEVAQRSEFIHKNQGWFCCGCHIFTLILAIVYVVGLVVCVAVYIMAAQQVAEVMDEPSSDENILKDQIIAWMENKSTYYNFPGTVSFVLHETIVLLNESSTNLIQTMNTTVEDLKGQINTTVEGGVTVVFNVLENVTGIDSVFNDTSAISQRLTDLMSSIDATMTNYNSTLKNAVGLNATFFECYKEIKANCNSTCNITDTELNILLFDFNVSSVKDPSPLSHLKAVAEKFEKIAKNIDELQKEITAMPGQLTSNIISNFNLTSQINELQVQLDEALNKVKPQVENLVKEVPQYVAKARPYVNPALYAPAVIMAVIALIFTACLLLFIAEAFHRRLFSPTGEGPSELAEVLRTKRRSHVCGGCRFLICSILFILLIIVCLAAAVVLVVCSLLAVEVCPYVYMEQGMNQSDYVLNSILTEQWPTIQQQQGDFLDIAPPQNVLYGLSVVCTPTDTTDPKLLPSVGIDKLANLTKLADGEDFKNWIEELINEVAKLVSTQIPQDLVKNLKDMNTSVGGLETALQLYNASGAVTELKKFTEVNMQALQNLKNEVSTKLPNSNVSKKLEATIEELKQNQSNIMDLQTGYQGIADQSKLPNELEKYIDGAVKTMELLKNEAELKGLLQKDIGPMLMKLIVKVLQVITDALNGLATKVLPCGNMHNIFEALVATGCSSSGLVNRFFGWALALTLTTLLSFLSFVGLFNLWCIQSHQIKRFYGS
ncbi:hypothetical protein TcWFU_001526 [Taenia crassiceps]|uniref:Uncharacterized protein n=1 Tax=Taenia crassiceps TaxID=6207 RepID=A0ABR4Q3D4_9CEST